MTTEELKAELAREADRRDALDADRDKSRTRIDELVETLRQDPHDVGVAELARIAKVSPQAIYKTLGR